MKCAEDYQAKQEALGAKMGSDVHGEAGATPSAPPTSATPSNGTESTAPSAPPAEDRLQPIETFQSNECVVCLEMKVCLISYRIS